MKTHAELVVAALSGSNMSKKTKEIIFKEIIKKLELTPVLAQFRITEVKNSLNFFFGYLSEMDHFPKARTLVEELESALQEMQNVDAILIVKHSYVDEYCYNTVTRNPNYRGLPFFTELDVNSMVKKLVANSETITINSTNYYLYKNHPVPTIEDVEHETEDE